MNLYTQTNYGNIYLNTSLVEITTSFVKIYLFPFGVDPVEF